MVLAYKKHMYLYLKINVFLNEGSWLMMKLIAELMLRIDELNIKFRQAFLLCQYSFICAQYFNCSDT